MPEHSPTARDLEIRIVQLANELRNSAARDITDDDLRSYVKVMAAITPCVFACGGNNPCFWCCTPGAPNPGGPPAGGGAGEPRGGGSGGFHSLGE